MADGLVAEMNLNGFTFGKRGLGFGGRRHKRA